MASIMEGDYDGVAGATPANQYRILAQLAGARGLQDLRPRVPAFIRQQQRMHMMALYVMDMIYRCSDVTRAHRAMGLR